MIGALLVRLNWLRVLQIALNYCCFWRQLIEESASTRCNRPPPRPTLRHGVHRIALTAPLWYAVVDIHLEPFAKLLRYLKLATSP